MDEDLKDKLFQYLRGRLSVADLAEYVEDFDIWSSAQDSDPRIRALRGPVGRLELSSTEVLEGLRPEQSLQGLVERLLREPPSKDMVEIVVALPSVPMNSSLPVASRHRIPVLV